MRSLDTFGSNMHMRDGGNEGGNNINDDDDDDVSIILDLDDEHDAA